MRLMVVALSALALAGLVASASPATAAKTKMGCERGKEVWNATLGKCEPGRSKTARRAGKKAAPKAPKKTK